MILRLACLLYLIAASYFDIRNRIIPDALTAGFFIMAAASSILTNNIKNIACAAFFLILFAAVSLATNGLGMGDAKLAAATGCAFGLLKASVMLLFSCIAGIIFCAALRITTRIPFAPFVLAGFIAEEIFMKEIL